MLSSAPVAPTLAVNDFERARRSMRRSWASRSKSRSRKLSAIAVAAEPDWRFSSVR
jgi:hypothetical protein